MNLHGAKCFSFLPSPAISFDGGISWTFRAGKRKAQWASRAVQIGSFDSMRFALALLQWILIHRWNDTKKKAIELVLALALEDFTLARQKSTQNWATKKWSMESKSYDKLKASKSCFLAFGLMKIHWPTLASALRGSTPRRSTSPSWFIILHEKILRRERGCF